MRSTVLPSLALAWCALVKAQYTNPTNDPTPGFAVMDALVGTTIGQTAKVTWNTTSNADKTVNIVLYGGCSATTLQRVTGYLSGGPAGSGYINSAPILVSTGEYDWKVDPSVGSDTVFPTYGLMIRTDESATPIYQWSFPFAIAGKPAVCPGSTSTSVPPATDTSTSSSTSKSTASASGSITSTSTTTTSSGASSSGASSSSVSSSGASSSGRSSSGASSSGASGYGASIPSASGSVPTNTRSSIGSAPTPPATISTTISTSVLGTGASVPGSSLAATGYAATTSTSGAAGATYVPPAKLTVNGASGNKASVGLAALAGLALFAM